MYPVRLGIQVKVLCGACLALAMVGCGFYLRGSKPTALQGYKLFVQSQRADPITAEIRTQLGYSGVSLAANPGSADAVVTLSGERSDERVLSVDPRTGKAREYELGYQVDVTVTRSDGTLLSPRQTVDLTRDLTFDETSVLGKFGEEALLREEMRKDAAQTILRRLETIKTK